MISKILVIIPLLLLSLTLQAQETEVPIEDPEETGASIKRHKYEIGLDMQWLLRDTYINYNYGYSYNYYNNRINNDGINLFGRINKSKLVPGSVMYRKYAFRFGISANASLLFQNDKILQNRMYVQNCFLGNNSYSIAIESGYEIQKQFKKFQLYYGFDVGPSYSFNSVSEYRQEPNSISEYNEVAKMESSIFQLTVSPLIGMKYFIHSRLSASLESKTNVGLFVMNEKEVIGGASSKRSGLNVWTTPIHALNLSYYFDL